MRLHRLIRELIAGGTPRALTAERAEALVSGLNMSDAAGLMRIELALDHIGDIKRFDRRIDQVTLKIHAAVTDSGTTLTRIDGVGPINAGLILGEVGDVSRFPTRNHFASYTGTAPIAVSSGDTNRHRPSRSREPVTQYFGEQDTEGRLFDRNHRSLVYQRAKNTHGEQGLPGKFV